MVTNVSQPQLIDLRLAAARFPAALEKWYLDVLAPDGTVVLLYLGRMSLFGVDWARVTIDVFFPDGRVESGASEVRAPRGSGDTLVFGSTGIEGERVHISAGEVRGELRYHARREPVRLSDPFLAEGTRSLRWSVEIPDADVEGELRWPGGRLAVRGRGYRDRVFFDLLPWRFPITRLVWGRAFGNDRAAFWVEARTQEGPVRAQWFDGTALAPACEGPPTEVELGPPRVLVESAVADLPGLRLGALRGLVRRLCRDPREVKWAAPCAIAGAPGRAIHEVVTWL